jgi:hypothetical protein
VAGAAGGDDPFDYSYTRERPRGGMSTFDVVHDFAPARSVMEFLGNVADFLGNALLPTEGSELEFSITGSVCVEFVMAKFSMSGSLARDADGFELKGGCEMTIGIGASAGPVAAYLGRYNSQSLTAKGKDVSTCLEEIALHADLWLRAQQFTAASVTDWKMWVKILAAIYRQDVSELITMVAGDMIADVLWGKNLPDLVAADMNPGDHVESTRTLAGYDGAVLFSDKASHTEASGRARVGVAEKLDISKSEGGTLGVQRTLGFFADLDTTGEAGGVSFGISGSAWFPPDGELELSAKITFAVDTAKLGQGAGAACVAAVWAVREALSIITAGRAQATGQQEEIDAAILALADETVQNTIMAALGAAGVAAKVGVVIEIDMKEIAVKLTQSVELGAGEGLESASIDFTKLDELVRFGWRDKK